MYSKLSQFAYTHCSVLSFILQIRTILPRRLSQYHAGKVVDGKVEQRSGMPVITSALLEQSDRVLAEVTAAAGSMYQLRCPVTAKITMT